MMTGCRPTLSLADSGAVRPGSALRRRGVEAQWCPRAVAASRKPGDTVCSRSAAVLGLVPSPLDFKFIPYASYMIFFHPPLFFIQACIGFATKEITTNYDTHLTVPHCNRLSFLLSDTTISTASGIYDIHIVLRRVYNSQRTRRRELIARVKWRVER